MPEARSRAGGYFYLSDRSLDPTKAPTATPTMNGAVHVLSHKLRNVLASAAEAEVGALFENGQEAVAIRNTLIDMGHKQDSTPIKTDNSTASGFANNTIKQRKSKSMDMLYYWIRDRCHLKQFIVYWRPGADNLADYFTKHHPASHHRLIRNTYLAPTTDSSKFALNIVPSMLQGCVKLHPARTATQAHANDRCSSASTSQNAVYESAQQTHHAHYSYVLDSSLIY